MTLDVPFDVARLHLLAMYEIKGGPYDPEPIKPSEIKKYTYDLIPFPNDVKEYVFLLCKLIDLRDRLMKDGVMIEDPLSGALECGEESNVCPHCHKTF